MENEKRKNIYTLSGIILVLLGLGLLALAMPCGNYISAQEFEASYHNLSECLDTSKFSVTGGFFILALGMLGVLSLVFETVYLIVKKKPGFILNACFRLLAHAYYAYAPLLFYTLRNDNALSKGALLFFSGSLVIVFFGSLLLLIPYIMVFVKDNSRITDNPNEEVKLLSEDDLLQVISKANSSFKEQEEIRILKETDELIAKRINELQKNLMAALDDNDETKTEEKPLENKDEESNSNDEDKSSSPKPELKEEKKAEEDKAKEETQVIKPAVTEAKEEKEVQDKPEEKPEQLTAPEEKVQEEKTSDDIFSSMNGRKHISFAQKLDDADPDLQKKYEELRDALIGKDLNVRTSFPGESFSLHRKRYAFLTINGKHIKMNLALNPEDYRDSKIPVSRNNAKKFEDIPLTFKVQSDLSLKRALLLINDLKVEK